MKEFLVLFFLVLTLISPAFAKEAEKKPEPAKEKTPASTGALAPPKMCYRFADEYRTLEYKTNPTDLELATAVIVNDGGPWFKIFDVDDPSTANPSYRVRMVRPGPFTYQCAEETKPEVKMEAPKK